MIKLSQNKAAVSGNDLSQVVETFAGFISSFVFCQFLQRSDQNQAKTVQLIFFIFHQNDEKRKSKDEMNPAHIKFKVCRRIKFMA